jgi:transposase
VGYNNPQTVSVFYLKEGIVSTQSVAEERLSHLEGHYADRVTAFRQRLAQVGLNRTLVVLLDIGKNVHWATAWTGSGVELVKPHRLLTTDAGLSQFIQMTDNLISKHTPHLVLLGHEPTGVYHEPWARALMDYYGPFIAGQAQPTFEYRFFNPYQVKLARQQTHLRHRKSDPRDLAAMYDLMLRGLGQSAFLPTGVELLIRQEVGFIRAQSRLLGNLERQLRQQIDRLWPGAIVSLKKFRRAHPNMPEPNPIIQTRPLQRDRLRVLLAHCPNPYDLMAMSDQQILDLYRREVGRAGPALLNILHTWVQDAVIPPREVATSLSEQVQRLFLQYAATETLIEDGLGRLTPLVDETCARHLPAIPGLGARDAAAYLAGVGSIQRFFRAAEVWAFAGFDPVTDGSGDKPDRVGRVSKHGDPAFRDAIFQMGFRVSQNYPPVSIIFLDAFERGKSEVEATIHAAHKVNRMCFHLMKNDEPFESQSTPQLETEKEHRWKAFKAAKKKRGKHRKRGKRRR